MGGMGKEDSAGGNGAERFSSCFVYLMTFGVSLGGLCYGYNLAVISGAMLYAQPFFSLDTTWQSVIVGAAVTSATVSSPVAGQVADKLGRRAALLMTALVSIAGSVLAAAAPSKEVLLAGRLCTGLSYPLIVAFCPLYIAEMTPASIRGRMIIIELLHTAAGMLLSGVLSGAFSYFLDNHWRYMLGFGAILGLMFGVAIFLLPESPRWLIAKERQQEATRVLQRIFGYNDVSHKVKDIEDAVTSDVPAGVCSTLSRILATSHVLKALAVGSCLSFFFVWSGINATLFFCGTLMKTVGFPVQHAVWVQGMMPLALFIGVFPVIVAVEKWGRRPIVLISLGGSTVSLVMMSVGFHITAAKLPDVHTYNMTNFHGDHTFELTNASVLAYGSACHSYIQCESCVQDPDCGLCYNNISAFCLPALNEHFSTLRPCAMDSQRNDTFKFVMDYCPTPYAWIVVAGVFLFALFFSGMATMTFTINAEIYPMWARSKCNSLTAAVFYVSNVIITLTFLSIVETLKLYGTYWFFTAMCTLGLVLLAIFLPETKNRSLEEVEELFMTSQQLQRHRQKRETNRLDTTDKEKTRSRNESNLKY